MPGKLASNGPSPLMRSIVHPSQSDSDRRALENNQDCLHIMVIMYIAILTLLFINNDATCL